MVFKCSSDYNPRRADQPARSYAIPRFALSSTEVEFSGPNTPDANGAAFGSYWAGRSLAEFPSVSATFMLVEHPRYSNRFGQTNEVQMGTPNGQGGPITISGTTYPDVPPLHFERWNYLFVDGHVK
jgi:hypothetical protein